MPWEQFDCEAEVRALLKERQKLIPRLKAAFDRYHKEGIPPVRALVCDYSQDENTYKLDDEYLFCADLLVAPIAVGEKGREVYLPKGNWINYFTKEPVESGFFHVETRGIPVYQKI